jgi:hypothetical protein
MTRREHKRSEGPARPIKTKRDYEHATTLAKRLSGQKSLDSTAELRLQSLLRELDKFDEPDEGGTEGDSEDYEYSGPRRRWSDDATGTE